MSLKVAVIGAGAAGLTTAWELSKAGCQVDVIEASNGIAEWASFASTGYLGMSGLSAWDFSGLPPLKEGASSLLLPPPWARSVAGLTFLRQRLTHLSVSRQDGIFQACMALAQLNNERIDHFLLTAHQEVESLQGAVVAFRSDAERDAHRPGMERVKRAAVPVKELDSTQTFARDTSVNPGLPLTGSMELPADRVINGRQWLAHVKTDFLKIGGRLHTSHPVAGLTQDGILHVRSGAAEASPQALRFDAVVLCTATASTQLLKPLGIELPMLVLNHCAISAPIRESTHAPTAVWIDARERIVLSRTGQRLRASGGVVVPGQSAQPVFKALYHAVEEWFPGAASLHGDRALVQNWQSSVGHTPDGLPLAGPTRHGRIWVNTGHGGRGWTLAAGAAKLLAELITRQTPSTDAMPYSPQRAMRV